MLPSSTLVDAYDAWWDGRARQPVLYYQCPVPGAAAPGPDASWLATPAVFAAVRADGDAARFDHLLDQAEAQADERAFQGAGFPRYFPNLGPGILAAFISGFSRFHDGTVWFELHGDAVLDLGRIPELAVPRPGDEHARLAVQLITRATCRFAGRMQLGMTDLGGTLDILAALRGTDRLLLDLAEEPEAVRRALSAIDGLWEHWFDRFDADLATASGGVRGCWMQLLSRRRFYPLQCDAAGMISPRMFATFVLPSLRRIAGHLGMAVFHLDGVAAQRHLPAILSVPEIRAVQWTPGAGQPGVADPCWFPLYRRIIDAGRQVVLLGFPAEPETLQRLCAALPGRSFLVHIEGPDQACGQRLLEAIGCG